MHQDRINKLHYSNASSIGKSRRYLVIKGGGACLVALARERGRQQRSRLGHQLQRQSRSLLERRGGRNNEYIANRCIAMHGMTSNDAKSALTW